MTTHPTDRDLMAFLNGPEQASDTQDHLVGCAACRARVAGAGPDVALPPTGSWESRHVAVAEELTGKSPAVGSVWRVAWEELRELALVIDAPGDGYVVLPVLDDPAGADDWTLLVAANTAGTDVELGVAVAHRFVLPSFVFDAHVGSLADAALTSVLAARAAFKRGDAPPEGTGAAVFSVLDPRSDLLGELADCFVELAEAMWVDAPASAVSTNWLVYDDLVGPAPDRLYELMGGATPTAEEISVAAAHGLSVVAASFAPTLLSFLDKPAPSARLRRSKRLSNGERAARVKAANFMTSRRAATAARGAGTSYDWAPLFEEFLSAQGD